MAHQEGRVELGVYVFESRQCDMSVLSIPDLGNSLSESRLKVGISWLPD